MFHNLYIQVSANAFLLVFWLGERAHNAYWVLMGDAVHDGSPFTVVDGPFPNQYMAASDFFKRGPKLSGWKAFSSEEEAPQVAANWEERYGVNFRKAFEVIGAPDHVHLDGVEYLLFLK